MQTSGVLSSSVTSSEFILFTEKKLTWFRSIVLKVELLVHSIRITGLSIGFCEKLENSEDATKLHKWILMYNTRETWSGANSCHPSFVLITSKFYFLYENALSERLFIKHFSFTVSAEDIWTLDPNTAKQPAENQYPIFPSCSPPLLPRLTVFTNRSTPYVCSSPWSSFPIFLVPTFLFLSEICFLYPHVKCRPNVECH